MNLKKRYATKFVTLRYDFLICLFLLIATVIVYWQVKNHEFINFDDPDYVTENKNVQSGLTKENIIRTFRFSQKGDTLYYHPVTMLSHMLDCELFGLSPGAHHLTNVLLHIFNTILLFLFLRMMTGERWQSAFVSALFALHPYNADTVAWVSERKNLLSFFFWFLTLFSYTFYVKKKSLYRYVLIIVFMLLGLLAKPTLVTMPCALLLIDLWPIGRIKFQELKSGDKNLKTVFLSFISLIHANSNLLKEKIPLFLLSALWVFISMTSNQRLGFLISTEAVPMSLRIANGLVSYLKYLWKMLWPFNHAIYYPYPTQMPPVWQLVGSAVFLGLISFLVFRKWKQIPWLTVGWLWYVGTLIPVIGITQNGLWPAIADRWTYIPLIGIYIIIAWGGGLLFQNRRYKKMLLSVSAIVLLALLLITTSIQLRHWRNSITVFTHAIALTTNNQIAHNSLGYALQKKGRSIDESIKHFLEALRINPSYAKAHNNLGTAFEKKGKDDQAIWHYKEAIRNSPDLYDAYTNLGSVLIKKGNLDAGINYNYKALQIDPDNGVAHYNIGAALDKQNRLDEAVQQFSMAIQKTPHYAEAHNNLGTIFVRLHKIEKALLHFRKALQIKPNYSDARENLKNVAEFLKKNRETIEEIQKALKRNPKNSALYYQLGNLYKDIGQEDRAISQYQKALAIQPEFIPALSALASIFEIRKDYDQSALFLEKIIAYHPENLIVYYNIACLYSRQNKIGKALDWLEKAIDKGYNNWQLIKTDKDLENIRSSSGYAEIVERR